jgi:LEA14-like dessication related protein
MVSFQGNADALLLDAVLKVAHGSQNHGFAIDPESMEVAQVILKWGKKRYRSEIKALLKFNRLIKTYPCEGKGNPSKYHQNYTLPQRVTI